MTWQWNWKKGYAFASPDIISDTSVTKVKGPMGSEEWGPYKKTYTKSMFGQMIFTPPKSVDGVPILCRCRVINQYMREGNSIKLGPGGALLFGSNRPACWEDSESIMNPTGGDTFQVTVGHPAFYAYAASRNGMTGIIGSFLGGRRKTIKHRKSKAQKKTRKVKRYQK